jgi:hypothetical protein
MAYEKGFWDKGDEFDIKIRALIKDVVTNYKPAVVYTSRGGISLTGYRRQEETK